MPRMNKISRNNTAILHDPDGTITVILHRTPVWKRYPDGTVELNSGGWRTVTTKTRITQAFNEICGYGDRRGVRQRKHEWYAIDSNGNERPFYDGIKLPS